MTEKGKKWLGNKGVDKVFRKENLVLLVLGGILLFLIALPTEKQEKGETTLSVFTGENETEKEILSGERMQGENVRIPEGNKADTDYAAGLEQRLTDALSDMAEVGRVRVMITLKSSSELVVERETPVTRSATTENDAQGGTRSINTSQMEEKVVYSTDGSSSEPYVIKTYVPEIEGVLVVAEGAGNGTVNRTVTEIVQALFGVEAHKVKVVRMEQKSD